MSLRCKKSFRFDFIIDFCSEVPGQVVPPNQCGVHFDRFYPEEFGQWKFWNAKRTKSATKKIETVEGPCSPSGSGNVTHCN